MSIDTLSAVVSVMDSHRLEITWSDSYAEPDRAYCTCGAAFAYDGCEDALRAHHAAEIARAVGRL